MMVYPGQCVQSSSLLAPHSRPSRNPPNATQLAEPDAIRAGESASLVVSLEREGEGEVTPVIAPLYVDGLVKGGVVSRVACSLRAGGGRGLLLFWCVVMLLLMGSNACILLYSRPAVRVEGQYFS